jgi:hypothetical protein
MGFFDVMGGVPRGCTEEGGHYVSFGVTGMWGGLS